MYKSFKEFIYAMRAHSCLNKNLIPADDPSNDIWSAKAEEREPLKYPSMGYLCQGCEEDFRIELRNCKSDDEEFEPVLKDILKSGDRVKLRNYLNDFNKTIQ
jgi:hypothetical protein